MNSKAAAAAAVGGGLKGKEERRLVGVAFCRLRERASTTNRLTAGYFKRQKTARRLCLFLADAVFLTCL